jgi:hypothetical protein
VDPGALELSPSQSVQRAELNGVRRDCWVVVVAQSSLHKSTAAALTGSLRRSCTQNPWARPSAGNAELVPNRHSGLHGGSERFTELLGSPRGLERRDQPRLRSEFFTRRWGPPRLVGRELYGPDHGEEASSEFVLSFFAYLTFRLGNWGSGARIA